MRASSTERVRAPAADRTTPPADRVTGKPPSSTATSSAGQAESDAVEDVVLADHDLVEVEGVHDHAEHERPGADDVDPAGVHDGQRGAALAGGGEQAGGHRTDAADRDPGAVDGHRVVLRQLQRQG